MPLDTDGDGLPDPWEKANGLDPLDPGDALADDDGDRQSNRNEYLAGTDPQDPDSRLAITAATRAAAAMQLTWSSVPGKQYRIQWSDDLVAWTLLDGGGSPVVVEASPGAATSYSVAIPGSPQPVRRFYRVELVVP